MTFGATPTEWAHFELVLGLTEDLLPVVSNPNAEISEKSAMNTMGKTPSVYNRAGKAVGISQWTTRKSTPAEIEKWAAKPDYGMCLQTRHVRGLDIDVPNTEIAASIVDFILRACPQQWPKRFRRDSGKCLLACIIPGEMPKRVMKLKDGIIEFLANGQQFIACGTHTQGNRYEWEGGLPSDFPVLTVEEFDALWAALASEFALEAPAEGALRNAKIPSLAVEDETYSFLSIGALGVGSEGQLYIDCPWKDGHTSDSGMTECAYFPKGTRGYEQGHFKCLHASCAKRTDDDFLDALGVAAADFDVIPDRPEPIIPSGDNSLQAIVPFSPYKLRRNKQGIMPILNNVLMSLRAPEHCGLAIKYDSFRDEIVCCPPGGAWRAFGDVDYTRLRSTLEHAGYAPISPENIRNAVGMVAADNAFDSAIEWVKAQEWDGVARVGTFLSRYWGADDTPYTRAVSRYLWTALAGRALQPGVKADMAPIMQGEQGVLKSSAIEAIAPSPALFCEIKLNTKEDDLVRRMRGKLVVEISELSGLHTRALEDIKAFIVRKNEQWVPKFKEFTATYGRRCVMVGTSNADEILADDVNRRWLPFRVTGFTDLAAIERDRKLLWAEARELFELAGVDWMEAQALAPVEHEKFAVLDEGWSESIMEWLEERDLSGTAPGKKGVTVREILMGALGFSAGETTPRDERRVRDILKKAGWSTTTTTSKGRTVRIWRKNHT